MNETKNQTNDHLRMAKLYCKYSRDTLNGNRNPPLGCTVNHYLRVNTLDTLELIIAAIRQIETRLDAVGTTNKSVDELARVESELQRMVSPSQNEKLDPEFWNRVGDLIARRAELQGKDKQGPSLSSSTRSTPKQRRPL